MYPPKYRPAKNTAGGIDLKKKKIWVTVEIIILIILLAVLAVYLFFQSKFKKLQTDEDNTKAEVNQEVVENQTLKGYTNIMLFGVDSRDQNLDLANSDTNIIASINNDTKEIRLVSVYRDTYMKVSDDIYSKCNDAYALGGPKQALSAFNTNLDLDIQHYVAVDFEALIETIDLLGGLEITVTDEESVHLNSYCQTMSETTGKEYEPLEGAGTYHLSGIQSTAYARIRYTAGNDFKRAQRQREVLSKMVEKVKKASLSQLNDIVDKVFPMVATNLTEADIISMGMQMLSYEMGEQSGFPFTHLEGENVTKAMGNLDCVVPVTLETNVRQLHQFLFEDKDYTPSETVLERSQYIIDKSGLDESDMPQPDDTIPESVRSVVAQQQ